MIVNVLFQCVCQVLVRGEGNLTDYVNPSIMETRLIHVEDIVLSLQDVMATQQRQHETELTSLQDTIVTRQRHYDAELTSLKQELIDAMVTKQQHEAELTSLKYELTITQTNHNKGFCKLFMPPSRYIVFILFP